MKLNNTKTTVFLTVITHCPILSQVMFSRGQDEQLLRTFDFLNCVLWNTSNTLDLRSNCFIELLPSSSRPPTVFYRVGNSEPPTRCLPSKHDRIMTAFGSHRDRIQDLLRPWSELFAPRHLDRSPSDSSAVPLRLHPSGPWAGIPGIQEYPPSGRKIYRLSRPMDAYIKQIRDLERRG